MVSFKKFCREHNYKTPLSKKYFDYYTSLGYVCFAVQKICGYYYLVIRTNWYDDLFVLTITELKFVIENYNNVKYPPLVKINKYINELRTSKR